MYIYILSLLTTRSHIIQPTTQLREPKLQEVIRNKKHPQISESKKTHQKYINYVYIQYRKKTRTNINKHKQTQIPNQI